MYGTVRFLLDGELYELVNPDPTETVLGFLRYKLARTGTKEGCAEGDCGACTVVIGEVVDEEMRYRAVNACILFLPTLDGKELITVESLKAKDGTLHPVQQAIVDTHGSQCGFCTPGFVMSLYAMYEDGGPATRERLNDTLAGNLCRCTGYGPLVEAGMRAQEARVPVDHMALKDKIESLIALKRHETLELTAKDPVSGGEKKYFAPVTMDALADLVEAYPDATILAGGTDVGLWVTKMHKELSVVIYTGAVAALKETRESGESVEIGAGVSVSDGMALLGKYYPDMGELYRRFASVQIRNSGTIGGNIANGSPIGDSPPALIAVGAQLVLRKGAAERTMPLEDYFIEYGKQDRAPGEFVARIIVPKPVENQRFRTYKISKRFDQDISAVCGAFGLTIVDGIVEDARIAFGGMAATPKRATAAETALVGKEWTAEAVEAAMEAMTQDYAPISDMRASADYRMQVAQNLLMKAFVETTEQTDTRLVGDKELAHV
ncbi:xanthine dehydrogenase small subunit [Kordiimonas lacus]|uniref:Xanthine dehydrogenase small subunit n=1 Tax=Kordiimonas lacus TaxID=637679 RepID=A0A1G6UA77_9PROT|nr:xanthine dehydrogenase small subunit [Kordiimonas lacus]SDD37455.1 xanthine dehydrogenase small subunit [Kordiimonas lacus]